MMIVMLMIKQYIEEQQIYLCSLSSSRLVHILVNRFLCCLRSVTNLHRCLSNSSLRFLHGSPNNGEHVMMLSVPRPPFLDMELFLVGLDTARHGPEGEDWGISKHQKDFFPMPWSFFHCHDLEWPLTKVRRPWWITGVVRKLKQCTAVKKHVNTKHKAFGFEDALKTLRSWI